MSIQIESENLPAGIHNLFTSPIIFENVGTRLVTDQMVADTREELSKSMEFSNVGGYQSATVIKGALWQLLFQVATAQVVK